MCERKLIKNLDAVEARKLADKYNFGNELDEIIESIFNAAKEGSNDLYVYKNLHSETIKELQLRGFLTEFPIDVEAEHYCIIRW